MLNQPCYNNTRTFSNYMAIPYISLCIIPAGDNPSWRQIALALGRFMYPHICVHWPYALHRCKSPWTSLPPTILTSPSLQPNDMIMLILCYHELLCRLYSNVCKARLKVSKYINFCVIVFGKWFHIALSPFVVHLCMVKGLHLKRVYYFISAWYS